MMEMMLLGQPLDELLALTGGLLCYVLAFIFWDIPIVASVFLSIPTIGAVAFMVDVYGDLVRDFR